MVSADADVPVAAAVGAVMAAACLVRVTSLSFILPALALVVLAPAAERRARARGALVALAVAAVLAGPYFVNCWRAYGDPLYSINIHATVYRETEGREGDPSLTATEYLRQRLRTQPVRMVDTIVEGLTSYPFGNKWSGFDRWHPAAGRWLSLAALLGMLLFAAEANGRLLLLIGLSSLLPYAATWTLIADWRFTAHTYPLFLLAAAWAPVALTRYVSHIRDRAGAARRGCACSGFSAPWS